MTAVHATVIAFALAGGAIGRAQPAAPADATGGFSLGVAAGDVTDTRAILWTRADEPGRVVLEVSTDPAFDPVALRVEADATPATDQTVKLDATGLDAETEYYYRFSRADDVGVRSRVGRFRTAPPTGAMIPALPIGSDAGSADGGRSGVALRFAFSGDSNFARAPLSLLSHAADEALDLFIWYGDTIYADVPSGGLGAAATLDEYRAKYRQMRGDAHVQALLASAAVCVGWDDHEVFDDYAGGDPELPGAQRDAAYRAFFEYMPIRASASGEAFRTYRSVRYGAEVEFFFIDGRQYRETSLERDCAGRLDPLGLVLGPLTFDRGCAEGLSAPRTMLGAAQLEWLLNGLAASTARYKFIVGSVPFSFLGAFPYDRWDGYDAERRAILEFIDANRIEGVVLLSTDIHACGFNPDLTRYFRRWRPDYDLPNRAGVAELIGGPIGTSTFHQTGVAIVGGVLGQPPAAVAGLVDLGERVLLDRWRCVSGFEFFRTDRYTYVLLEVLTGDDRPPGCRVVFRGVDPEAADDGSPEAPGDDVLETLHTADLSAPPAPSPCGCPLLICTLAGMGLVRPLLRRGSGRSTGL